MKCRNCVDNKAVYHNLCQICYDRWVRPPYRINRPGKKVKKK